MKTNKIGILRGKVIEAFNKLKAGNLKQFVNIISDVSDVRYAWQKSVVDKEIENQLKELCSEKKYCKDIIGQHKKESILNSLK